MHSKRLIVKFYLMDFTRTICIRIEILKCESTRTKNDQIRVYGLNSQRTHSIGANRKV